MLRCRERVGADDARRCRNGGRSVDYFSGLAYLRDQRQQSRRDAIAWPGKTNLKPKLTLPSARGDDALGLERLENLASLGIKGRDRDVHFSRSLGHLLDLVACLGRVLIN